MASKPKASTLYSTYNSVSKKKPGQFKYDDKNLKTYYDKLMNRKDFSFDLNGNALYQQYKDQFTKQGQMAMMDTIGQASAMTGGYGNSYAQTAGQQIYQQNLSQLTDKIPELYQLAMNQYQMEGDNLLNLYGVAASERDNAYNQYRDKVSDWQSDRDFSYDAYTDQLNYEYQQGRDKVADSQWQKTFNENKRQFQLGHNLDLEKFNESKRQYNQTFAYNQGRDAVADSQWQKQFNYNQQRDSVADSQWQQQFDYNKSNDAANRSLEQQRLNETVRSNKASEKIASNKANSSSGSSKSKSAGTSGSAIRLSSDLGKEARSIYSEIFYTEKSKRGKMIDEAYRNGEITEEEAEFLYETALIAR